MSLQMLGLMFIMYGLGFVSSIERTSINFREQYLIALIPMILGLFLLIVGEFSSKQR